MKRTLITALFLLAVCWAPVAEATRTYTSNAHALARICVSERSWHTESDDCGMIFDVMQGQAERRGQTLTQRLRRYAHHSSPGQARRFRGWVRFLRLDGERPERFPRNSRWERTRTNGTNAREAWIDTLDEAQRLVDGEQLPPCSEPVHHWGGPMVDGARIERLENLGRWHRVDCGHTYNVPLGPGPE